MSGTSPGRGRGNRWGCTRQGPVNQWKFLPDGLGKSGESHPVNRENPRKFLPDGLGKIPGKPGGSYPAKAGEFQPDGLGKSGKIPARWAWKIRGKRGFVPGKGRGNSGNRIQRGPEKFRGITPGKTGKSAEISARWAWKNPGKPGNSYPAKAGAIPKNRTQQAGKNPQLSHPARGRGGITLFTCFPKQPSGQP